MYSKLLNKDFFRSHPFEEMSPQRIVYLTVLSDELVEMMHGHAVGKISAERQAQLFEDRSRIESTQDPNEVFELLRESLDVLARPALIHKALQYAEVLLPRAAELLLRDEHQIFIDNAFRLLAKCEQNYCPFFMERYHQIKNPHVRSLVCLLAGVRGDEGVIPWVYERFFELKTQYPENNYAQGPLLALYELRERFYG